ncbi:SDR family NAD(P)-dependent oxidoreductase [Xenorhabdus bovienii]|uniref:SDR family NAD(P)-dependent oxidoreductase n=1 Tax=Xenorhabdus bovienii TaxID=40576 RepID=UPI0023B2C124|nr:SDR family NAD(P)-dependent oxidoreductase [Xenorhabdus bovienii]MDE9430276.1 SDR family NAD(P)-dependent oxidoreductase [Xenorhabdus bovienii]
MNKSDAVNHDNCIAIVGMAGEFPGADSIEQLWLNLVSGTCSIISLAPEELENHPLKKIDPKAANFVPVSASLKGAGEFDADFFDFSAREAEITDPQHRKFLTCAWRALEDAAIDSERFDGVIGVAAGGTMSSYLMNCLSHKEIIDTIGLETTGIGNNLDFLATLLSYKLNLQGPSYAIQTSCSTSLVAVHSACQMLLNHEADLALAGAVSISVPQNSGYMYQEGGILSPDGICRTFDEEANGTVFGNGVGVIVLQRLEDAIVQNSRIHAVIRGSAINNDGRQKIGFTAPSVDGQSQVIVESMAVSGVEPDSISLVEAHGTGTRMGDPVEVAALTNAFRRHTTEKQFCALSSVKPNIGHLDAAAGMAGLIKTVMSLKHQMLPPSINVTNVNRDLDIENTPFYINRQLTPWKSENSPRRAGVSSMGIGGTNAHVILEEWNDSRQPPPKDWQEQHVILPLSAKNEQALATLRRELADYLTRNPDVYAADVAYTIAVGRRCFACRQIMVLPAGLSGAALAERILGNHDVDHIDDITGELWIQGNSIDWLAYYQELDCQRISLPGYPLANDRYWLDYQSPVQMPVQDVETTIIKQADPTQWFWQHSWRRQLLAEYQTSFADNVTPWLIFVRKGEPSEQIAYELEQNGQALIRVYPGEQFSQQSERCYSINPESAKSYRQLIHHLSETEKISHILHGWTVSKEMRPEEIMTHGFYSGLYLLKALAAETEGQLHVWLLTHTAFQVCGDETPSPYHVLINGLNRVVTQESGRFLCRLLDLSIGEDVSASTLAQPIIAEVTQQTDETVIALRHGLRWVFTAEPLPLHAKIHAEILGNSKEEGVYIITGGLGQFGLAAARYFIARHPQSTLILTSHTDITCYTGQRAPDNNIERIRLEVLETLRQQGQVDVIQADASDARQFYELLDRIITQYGKVTGIIHAAGLIGEQTHLSFIESDRQHCEHMFSVKVKGTQAIIDTAFGKDIDFVMFVSSLSPLLGGLGLTAYAAANSFMDSCATKLNRLSPTHWISVNWEGWVRQGGTTAHYDELGKEFQTLSLSDEEIGWCFERILANRGLSNVIISTGSLTQRMQRWSTHSGIAEITGTRNSVFQTEQTEDKEAIILEMARQLLGTQLLEVDDDLFVCGADSLTAIQLIARIRDVFKVDLPMQTLFDKPTVASLASSISPSDENGALLSLVEELESMDEEEADKLSQQIDKGKTRWTEI